MRRATGTASATRPTVSATTLPTTRAVNIAQTAIDRLSPAPSEERRTRRRRVLPYLLAFAIYQMLSLVAWWHLLADGIGGTLPAGSADAGQEVWFFAWVVHALGAGENPFFSHFVFAPTGIDVLTNTSVELLGLVFAPITVLWGSVPAFDVATMMAPAVSALSAYALCRRYVSWQPAAFLGGLCYGFGPFIATDLRYGHLDLTWLALPPLILLAVDELFVRQHRRPALTGCALGVMLVLQFFVSTEMLAVTVLTVIVALFLAAGSRPRAVAHRLRVAAPGVAAALGISAVALAYPLWVVTAGPRHVNGAVWPDIGSIAASLQSSVQPHAELMGVAYISGGNGTYLGIAFLLVLLVGSALFWSSVPLRLALVLGFVCFVAELGYHLHVGARSLPIPLPAAVLGHIPLLDSIAPERFAAMVDLFFGGALAIIVDHVHQTVVTSDRLREGRATTSRLATAAAVATAGVAIVPLLFVPPWPYAAASTGQAPVLTSLDLSNRPNHGTSTAEPYVVVYPDAPTAVAHEMVWQAESGYSYSLIDGYAIVPRGAQHAQVSPTVNALWVVLAAASLGRLELPLTSTTRQALRQALKAAHVTDVVVLPGAVGSDAVRGAFSSALGPPSRWIAGAAVWTSVQ